jgi:hypothetical protein
MEIIKNHSTERKSNASVFPHWWGCPLSPSVQWSFNYGKKIIT